MPFLSASVLLPELADIHRGMEEQRVSAVWLWPVPSNIKAVQRFLGFSNYFRHLIRGFSTVVAPLKGDPRQLRWTGKTSAGTFY